ncbi:hypothetical protein DSO57_1013118 [Entomophthora muscae]|uniref:Uncharacterized protein n=1 Tax=Entomophthora muscae TaxID=34485 RepID=A0ACC2U3U9_9FUNG|nr:hypothetical protein DSO57_1013118 [Entomophthora muscae]
MEIINFSLLGTFLAETLVRAALTRGGWLGYFSNPWNLLDFALIVASAVLEILDLLNILEVADESTMFGIVRVVSSLRTISMLHRNTINTESLINRAKKDTIAKLLHKINARESENISVSDELGATNRQIQKVKDEAERIKTHVIITRKKSWDQLVPKSFSISKVQKDSKGPAKSTPKKNKSTNSFKVVRSSKTNKRLSLPLLSFNIADVVDTNHPK